MLRYEQGLPMSPILLCRWQPYLSEHDINERIQAVDGCLANASQALHALCYHHLQTAPATTDSIQYGAENMLPAGPKDFASHFAANMLTDVNASFVVIGDSERRDIFHETEQIILTKAQHALEKGIRVALCTEDPNLITKIPVEHTDKLLLVIQGPWMGFYKDNGLIEELTQAINRFKQVAPNIPLLIALPRYVNDKVAIVQATIHLCAGYYFPKATNATGTIMKIAEAIAHVKNTSGTPSVEIPDPAKTESESQPSVEDNPHPST
jgi:hypothetical protein